MTRPFSRWATQASGVAAPGWRIERRSPPSRLYGANGLLAGPDGRLHVAQVVGSQVSAIDPDTGEIEAISPMGAGIIGPDDLAYDEAGNLYCAEFTEGRVSMRSPDGTTRILRDDLPGSNPITCHRGRLIAGECRYGGRIVELDRDGGPPRVILDGLPLPNAFEVGPDGKLYFPLMLPGEIWRVDLAGGVPEVVARGLSMPDSVKFDAGGQIVSTQFTSGEVLRIDPLTGAKTQLARIRPGLDNCAFLGERLFASHLDGSIHEIISPGRTRIIADRGLEWPMGLAFGADGTLFVADGILAYLLLPNGRLESGGMQGVPGFPGFVRGVAAGIAGEWIVTTAAGDIAAWKPAAGSGEPIASGLDQPIGIIPNGAGYAVAEFARGRVMQVENGTVAEITGGLDQPMGLARHGNGVLVSEAGAGRVSRITGGRRELLLDGLARPEGLAIAGDTLFVLDIGVRTLIALNLPSGRREIVAYDLPVGSPPGVPLQFLNGFGAAPGALLRFAGLAAAPDGTIYLSADGEGSIMALCRADGDRGR